MVDARAIAYMIPCGRPRGPAVRDQVTPSLIMINGVPQCPGRDIITIRKEIVRNGLYGAGHDRDRNGLAGGRWRCDGMVRRAVADRGGCAGRAHRGAVGRDRGRPARDRHAGAPRLRRARRGGVGGRAGSRAGREPCRAAAPERRVRIREPDCGEAVLAARARLRAWGGRRFGGSVAARPRDTDPAVDGAAAASKPHPPRRGAAGRGGRAGESW